jgi:hypothetical protein
VPLTLGRQSTLYVPHPVRDVDELVRFLRCVMHSPVSAGLAVLQLSSFQIPASRPILEIAGGVLCRSVVTPLMPAVGLLCGQADQEVIAWKTRRS